MNDIHDPKHPVILFIPEAGIYPFLRGLSLLGDAVIKKGGTVFITRDTGQMLRSPLAAMWGYPVYPKARQKRRLRGVSKKYLDRVKKKYHFSFIELSDFVDEELMDEINSLTKSKNIDLQTITYRDFPVGKIAQYDFILETKFPYSEKLSETHRLLYEAYIKNTALAIAITDQICDRYSPSLIMTFNEYAQCQAVRYSAQTHGVARAAITYPVHFNVDASRLSIWKSTCEYWRYVHCQNWHLEENTPIRSEHVDACWNDSLFRMYSSGSHIFSSRKGKNPADIFHGLGLDVKKKTIVAYTSSQDERGSVEIAMNIWGEDNNVQDAFPNQISWLKMLRDYAATRDDIQVVVRIHPREGIRQFKFDSQHLTQLKEVFTENSKNFFVVWPDNPISSYDLMELADVCLVSWSLMGQEAARLGIPVLTYTGNMFYPDSDFIQVGVTPEEYKKRLDQITHMDYSWKHLIKAVRFYHWRIFLLSLDLGKTVPVDFEDNRVFPELSENKVRVVNDILSGKEDLITYNIQQWKSSLPENAENLEMKAMQRGIRYFLDKLFYPPFSLEAVFGFSYRASRKAWKFFCYLSGKRIHPVRKTEYPFIDYHLELHKNVENIYELCKKSKQNKKMRFIVIDGKYVYLVHNGKVLKRMSQVVIRLVTLHQEIEGVLKLGSKLDQKI